MPEVFSYIFRSLEVTEKALRNQARTNRNMVVLAAAITAYAIVQTKRIDILEKEVKELKHQKGD